MRTLATLGRAAASVLILLTCASSASAEEDIPWVRNDDPVVILGAKLFGMVGSPLGGLSLMRCGESGYEVIPFQVDERLPSGGYAFTHGEQAARDPNPDLDGNDELVFLAADAGRQCAATPAPDGAERSVEIEVRDRRGATRWAYLFSFKGTPPRSPVDYITGIQDAKRKVWRVEGKTYKIEQVKNAVYYNYLSTKGNDGTWSENLVDRLKIRGEVSLLWGIITIPIHADELYRLRVDAWIDGPVRIVELSRGYLDAFQDLLKIPLKGDSLVYLYPTYFIFPVTIHVPVDADSLLTSIRLRGVNEFHKNVYAHGLHFYDAHNPHHLDVVIDGKLSDAERQLKGEADRDWMVLIGERGATLNRIVFPKEWAFITKRLYYVEDETLLDPPEAEPGVVAVGYEFDGLIEVKSGSENLFLHYYFPEDFKVGDERRLLDIVDDPLHAATRLRD